MPPLKPLGEKEFKQTIDELLVLQASVHVMCSKVQGFRINIVGGNFYEYHSFLGLVVEKLEKAFYDIGERVRMLGGLSNYSAKRMLDISKVKDATTAVIRYDQMVSVMHDDFIELSSQSRSIFANAGPVADAGTIALCTGLCFTVFDHFAWETRVMKVD
jgi:DNA-binding ferritin-like protein